MSLLSGWPVVSRTQLILPLKTVSAAVRWQYGGADLVANPRCLVWAEPDGCGGRERALAGLLAVVVEGDGSALASPPS